MLISFPISHLTRFSALNCSCPRLIKALSSLLNPFVNNLQLSISLVPFVPYDLSTWSCELARLLGHSSPRCLRPSDALSIPLRSLTTHRPWIIALTNFSSNCLVSAKAFRYLFCHVLPDFPFHFISTQSITHDWPRGTLSLTLSGGRVYSLYISRIKLFVCSVDSSVTFVQPASAAISSWPGISDDIVTRPGR